MARYINVDSALQRRVLREVWEDERMRLIDADALLEKAWDADTRIGYVQVVDVGDVIDAPTISPDEVRGKGTWILVDGIDEQAMARVHYIYCSNCGRQGLETRRGNDCRSNYCPHCGAKMEVE